MYFKLILLFFSFLSLSQVVLADSATLNDGATTNSQQDIDGNDEFLTVTNNSTLNTGATKPANITGDTVSVTVDSGSTITSNTVSIFADDTSDLTISNSGTISSSGIVAIDVKGTTDASITNNSGGQISATRNTIRISKSTSNSTTGLTITNSGTIEAFKILKVNGLMFFDDFLQYDENRILQSYEGIDKFLSLYSDYLKIEYFQNNLVVRKK